MKRRFVILTSALLFGSVPFFTENTAEGAERKDYVDEVKNAGFDIIHIAKEMEEYYIEKAKK